MTALALSLLPLGCSQAPSEPLPSSASTVAPDSRPTSLPESPDEVLGVRLPVRVKIRRRTDTFVEFTVASTPSEVKSFLERQLDETKVTATPDGGYELLGRLPASDPGPLLHWASVTKDQGLVRVVMQTRPDPTRFVPPRRDDGPLEPGELIVAEGVELGADGAASPDSNPRPSSSVELRREDTPPR